MVEYYQRRSAKEPLEQVRRPYMANGLWVHVPDKRVDLAQLAEEYALDANILRDVYDRHELPRIEHKEGASYIFTRVPSAAIDGEATSPFLAIVKSGHFFTISPHTQFSPKNISAFLTNRSDRPSTLLVALLASIVAEYESRVNTLEEKIVSARKRLKYHDVKNADFIEFVTIEDRLNEYRSSLESEAGVTRQLKDNRHGIFTLRDVEALEDISLHIEQLLVSMSASAQTIASIQAAYSTIANNTLNQRMKALTAITILLAIPNVFYGMYGMNIALPLQHEPWAYPAIAGFTLLLILLVFLLARRFRLF